MDLKLSGLNAVVAGASKGLGYATAQELLNEGASVIINSRSEKNLEIAKNALSKSVNQPIKVHSISGDVTNESFCKDFAAKSLKLLNGVDILITNSGGPPAGSFETLNSTQWEQAIDLSFKSHLFLIKYFLPALKNSLHPSVLAVTSFTIKHPLDNLILSNSIRAATAALIKSLSIELGNEGIRFNSILPGWTLTDRVDALLSIRAKKNNTTRLIEQEKIAKTIPLMRMGNPDEFARAATFLVSPAASYITGVLLTVDGGITKSLF